jgi:hypothetical protein
MVYGGNLEMRKILMVLLLIPMLLTGCSKLDIKITATNKSLGDMLCIAFDGFASVDTNSNNGMKYIAIDLSSVPDITDADKDLVSAYMKKKYNVEIKYESLKTLESKGLYKTDAKHLDGPLFTIKEVIKDDDNDFTVKGTKFRSVSETQVICDIEYVNGSWKKISTETPTPSKAKA